MSNDDRLYLQAMPTGDEIALGMSPRKLQEGMSMRASSGEGKAMTGSGAVRPTTPPPKPSDLRSSAKPKA